MSFWQEVLDRSALQKGFKALGDPNTPMSSAGGETKSKEEYFKWLQDQITREYNRFPKAKQDEYVRYDEEFGGLDPTSVEGVSAAKEEDIAGAQALDESDLAALEPYIDRIEEATLAAASGGQAEYDRLNELIAGIKDPELAAYVGDITAQLAQADPRDIEAQQRQLAKLEGLSDPTITAEEKLMMEMSRRQTEGDLRAQRGALKNDLQARGVYGSGAEITQNAMAQQEAAQRQALEMLGAQANASQRSMKALEGAADLSTSMRASSAGESQYNATAMTAADKWNKDLRRQYNEWKDKTEKENIDRQIARGEKIVGNVVASGKGGVEAASNIYDLRSGNAGAKADVRGKYLPMRLGIKDVLLNKGVADDTEEEVETIT